MLNRNLYILGFSLMVILFSAKSSFAQTDRSNSTTENNVVSSGTIDFNTTINPRPDLAGKENIENVKHLFVKIDQVSSNTGDEDPTDADKEIIENTKESFNEVINPRTEK